MVTWAHPSQMTSRSVQPLLQGSRSCPTRTVRQTYRQFTEHKDVCRNSPGRCLRRRRREPPSFAAQSPRMHATAAAGDLTRAVLTNGHTGHVPKAPDFFLFEGPPTGCGEIIFFKLIILLLMLLHDRTHTHTLAVHIWST